MKLGNNFMSGTCCGATQTAAAKYLVSSKVVDFTTNQPIENVNVYVKGDPTRGSATSSSGDFAIEVTDNDVLVLSHISYGSIEVPATDLLPVEYLSPKSTSLDEVVVFAKKNKTYIGWGLLAAAFLWAATRKKEKRVKAEV